MIKVVNHGKDKVYKIDCKKCSSTLEYKNEDIEVIKMKNINYIDNGIEKEFAYYECIICPVCKYKILKEILNLREQKIYYKNKSI